MNNWILCWRDIHGCEHRSHPMPWKTAQAELHRAQKENGALKEYWLEVAPEDRREIKPERWGRG